MQNFNSLSAKLSLKQPEIPLLPKWWFGGVLILSFAGFLDAAYLTAKHYLDFSVNCSLVHGCEQVLSSPYAMVLGIPIALVGVFYYLAIFISTIALIDRKKFFFLKVVVILPIVGFFFTIWLLITQIFFLEAFCLYCLFSAAFTASLFILAFFVIFRTSVFVKSPAD